MGIPWYLNPLWQWDLHDRLDDLELSSDGSRKDDLRQDKEIERLKRRVTDLENQLLALEKLLSDQGLLPPEPADPGAPELPPDAPAVFPARTEEVIRCPRCGRRQKGDRNCCYACGLPFRYEDEAPPEN